jgi:hypothetical protein
MYLFTGMLTYHPIKLVLKENREIDNTIVYVVAVYIGS